jgi:hypothetical protein
MQVRAQPPSRSCLSSSTRAAVQRRLPNFLARVVAIAHHFGVETAPVACLLLHPTIGRTRAAGGAVGSRLELERRQLAITCPS